MPDRPFRIPLGAALAAVGALVLTSVGAVADSSGDNLDPSILKGSSHRFGDAKPHPGAKTIPLWTGQTTNPDDGVTYTYTMVGADPDSNQSSKIQVDIVPLNVNLLGRTFNGSDAVEGVLASPAFQDSHLSSNGATSTRAHRRGARGALSDPHDAREL